MQARIEGRPGGSEPLETPKRLPVSCQRCMPSRSWNQQRAQMGMQPPEEASRQFARRYARGLRQEWSRRPTDVRSVIRGSSHQCCADCESRHTLREFALFLVSHLHWPVPVCTQTDPAVQS